MGQRGVVRTFPTPVWHWLPLSLVVRARILGGALSVQQRRVTVDRLGVPVIVGNLSAGGTGKTPITIWLVNELKRERGFGPASSVAAIAATSVARRCP